MISHQRKGWLSSWESVDYSQRLFVYSAIMPNSVAVF
jgi:hypothetical protein